MPTNQILVSLTQLNSSTDYISVWIPYLPVFWDVTLYFPVEIFRRFGATYCLHIHGRSLCQSSSPACCLLVWLTLQDRTFLRNIGKFIPDCTLSHSKTQYYLWSLSGIGLHLSVSAEGQVTGSSVHGIESSPSMNGVE